MELSKTDQKYLDRLWQTEIMYNARLQYVNRIEYIEQADLWLVVTDKQTYTFTDIKEFIGRVRRDNFVPNYDLLTKKRALAKAELITDLIISTAQVGLDKYSSKKLNQVISELKHLL